MPEKLVRWLSDYLENRYQAVKIGNELSSAMPVSSGVPQGSLLGPFLFSIVMGSLTFHDPQCQIIKYADDITLCMPIFKNTSNTHIADAHDKLISWTIDVGLQLNMGKCKTLVIPRSTKCSSILIPGIQTVKQITLLGVVFNDKLTWKEHIDKVVKISSRRLFPLRVLKPYLDRHELRNAYYGVMRSIMEYAAPLFVGLSKTDADRLEKLQRRFHRLLCGKECKEACLTTITERRRNLACKLYRSAASKDHILHPIVCRMAKSGRYILPHLHTSRRLNTFAIKTAILLNETT